ncbi:class A beta-lactamase-related serine hydrolase [Zobellia amurskyensis]|uniref:Class A beta-lactamase-related serine hydrolase n=1 Tax=Zobellia amurskyensis TaxID=248905 RepID=A0A7X2ZTA9_9FLAO|nr:serine hydrolase domain-containing protein [Zobellia amurskyensis]MUH35964.1 class A beta-lactamase-related serine hydrolase [Zobellia amurskyensis]
MNPILKYIKNVFAKKRILGDEPSLNNLVAADMLLQNLVKEGKVPGLAITVLKDGERFFQKGYGFANMDDKVLINPETSVFRIASVSKPISATALAHMVAEGLIDMDASFYTYVPYYPKKKYDFTIRQLASHTAGIRGYRGIEYGLNKPYSIKESIELFKDDELLFEPGTDYLYNSFDWVLISLAMQEVSGIPFEEYVEQKVLQPLEMDHTFWPDYDYAQLDQNEPGLDFDNGPVSPELIEKSGQIQFSFDEPKEQAPHEEFDSYEKNVTPVRARSRTSDVVKFYSKNRLGFREAIPVDNFYKLAGGGFLSTAADVAKFGQAHLDEEVLTSNLEAEFLRAQMVNGVSTYYGLGWQVSEDAKGRSYYGHVGNGVGGYSNLFVYPGEQMVFSILTNCTDPKIQSELDAVIDKLISSKETIQ